MSSNSRHWLGDGIYQLCTVVFCFSVVTTASVVSDLISRSFQVVTSIRYSVRFISPKLDLSWRENIPQELLMMNKDRYFKISFSIIRRRHSILQLLIRHFISLWKGILNCLFWRTRTLLHWVLWFSCILKYSRNRPNEFSMKSQILLTIVESEMLFLDIVDQYIQFSKEESMIFCYIVDTIVDSKSIWSSRK